MKIKEAAATCKPMLVASILHTRAQSPQETWDGLNSWHGDAVISQLLPKEHDRLLSMSHNNLHCKKSGNILPKGWRYSGLCSCEQRNNANVDSVNNKRADLWLHGQRYTTYTKNRYNDGEKPGKEQRSTEKGKRGDQALSIGKPYRQEAWCLLWKDMTPKIWKGQHLRLSEQGLQEQN